MSNTKTPGMLYALRQEPSTLFWQVVPVETAQGEALRGRGEPHVYDTAAQAQAVRLRLNLSREVRHVVPSHSNYLDLYVRDDFEEDL